MTDAPAVVKGMTMEEFIRRSDQEGPFELIDGEIKPKMPNVFGHGKLANHLAFLINVFTVFKKNGRGFCRSHLYPPTGL